MAGERKEAPPISIIQTICRNVQVVEIAGVRKYQVAWKEGTLGVGEAEQSKGKPAICYFDTAEKVIHQHERVLERYLGTAIPLAANKVLEISGETQKMAKISQDLASLAREAIIPFTPTSSLDLKARVTAIRDEIGGVTNEYKLKAQAKLAGVGLEDERKRTQAALGANMAILERASECLGIVGGTASRLRIVTRVKNEWEETMAKTFYEIAEILNGLKRGEYAGLQKREQLVRHISGGSEFSLAGKLDQISGPEYWERIQSADVRGLWQVGGLLREGDDRKAKAFLEKAILKLERVAKERKERERKK